MMGRVAQGTTAMEFFARAAVPATASFLQTYVRIETLPRLCAFVERVLSHAGERGEIVCPWGQLRVHREALGDGVRFTLPNGPHCLQWTVTAERGGQGQGVRVHCTTNAQQHDDAFAASLERFVFHWRLGLERELARLRAEGAPKPGGESMPWFG